MFKKFLNSFWIDIIFIFIISLIPLLWYSSGTLGFGHDMGWSLVPLERFIDRLSSWTSMGFGLDQSLDAGAITIYVLPAILSLFNFSVITVQQLTYVFWFFAMACSMYYLVRTIYGGTNARKVALLAGTFYVLNHFTLQAWTVAELSKFSAMVILPILLANIWRVVDKRMSLIKGAAVTGIFFFIFNGGCVNFFSNAKGLPTKDSKFVKYNAISSGCIPSTKGYLIISENIDLIEVFTDVY